MQLIMRFNSQIQKPVLFVSSCLVYTSHLLAAAVLTTATMACSHTVKRSMADLGPQVELRPAKETGPVLLRLKAEPGRNEQVEYLHHSSADAFENQQKTQHNEETLKFVSQTETLKSEPDSESGPGRFTQVLTVLKKEGTSDLHDFAMPEPGESLEVTADSLGRILKSGDYPPNSLFFVPPISLPQSEVAVGDTWTMQAGWLSLEDMVPYQLDMVSILKGFWKCGDDTCADIEISGDVGFQGPLSDAMSFHSNWRGRIYFALKSGAVVWSRVESEERIIADNTRREVNSCLEAVLQEPTVIRRSGLKKPTCDKLVAADTETIPQP